MEDNVLIDKLNSRDESALAGIREKYGRLCLSIANNILSQPQDAEECLNSALYQLWNNIPPDRPDNLQAYLCRIVRNLAIDRCRYNSAEKRSSEFSVSLDELAECIPDGTDSDFESKRLAEVISGFLRTLDDVRRRVFVRRYWYGDTVAQIAQHYGLKENTVATYLFRTRKKLKNYLEKEGHLWIK